MSEQSNRKLVNLDDARRRRSSTLREVADTKQIRPAVAASLTRGRERRKQLQQLVRSQSENPLVPNDPQPVHASPKRNQYISYSLAAVLLVTSLGCMLEGTTSKDLVRRSAYGIVGWASLCAAGYVISKQECDEANSYSNSNSYKE